MILSLAAMLLAPVSDTPFTVEQWAECGQLAMFRAESATGDPKDELVDEAIAYFDAAGAIQFPGKELSDADYELIADKGTTRLRAQIGAKSAGADEYAKVTLATCRLEKLHA